MKKYPFKFYFIIVMSILEPIAYLIPIFISADVIGIFNPRRRMARSLEFIQNFNTNINYANFIVFISFLNEILAHRVSTDITADLFRVTK